MIRTIALTIAILSCASIAHAQPNGGHVGLFSDANIYQDSCVQEHLGQVSRVYVVHTTYPEGSAARFRVQFSWDPGPLTVTYGSNTTDGALLDGATVTYDTCRPLPYQIAVIEWVPTTLAPICSTIEVVPDPAAPSGLVDVFDCAGATRLATGGILIVNPTSCTLQGEVTCGPVSSQVTTWGLIKSLYTE